MLCREALGAGIPSTLQDRIKPLGYTTTNEVQKCATQPQRARWRMASAWQGSGEMIIWENYCSSQRRKASESFNLVNSNQSFPDILRAKVNVYRLALIFRLVFCCLKIVIPTVTLFTGLADPASIPLSLSFFDHGTLFFFTALVLLSIIGLFANNNNCELAKPCASLIIVKGRS